MGRGFKGDGTAALRSQYRGSCLRNDGRVWVPMQPGDKRSANEIPEAERDYFLEARYPSLGNLLPRDVASRNAKQMIDGGRGVDAFEAVELSQRSYR